MSDGGSVNLAAPAAEAAGREGVIWTLGESEDLNANLVSFSTGEGVGEHLNDEVDVIFLGVYGSGVVNVDGEDLHLSKGNLVFVPKGARRSTRSVSEDFAYLTVHRRRGPLRIGKDRKIGVEA
ncbi:MAG: cupin domain-containing protein [Rubrobacteraceae bacterium]